MSPALPAAETQKQHPGPAVHALNMLSCGCRAVPSFLYAMPFSKNRIFLEETSLVAKPAVPYQELQRRLEVLHAGFDSLPLMHQQCVCQRSEQSMAWKKE